MCSAAGTSGHIPQRNSTQPLKIIFSKNLSDTEDAQNKRSTLQSGTHHNPVSTRLCSQWGDVVYGQMDGRTDGQAQRKYSKILPAGLFFIGTYGFSTMSLYEL